MSKRIKTKDEVKRLLESHPHLKDDDRKLIATFWNVELKRKGHDAKEISGLDVLREYAHGRLTNAESIRRMRAKLQEEFPELRGKEYNNRKGGKQDDWKNDLGYPS